MGQHEGCIIVPIKTDPPNIPGHPKPTPDPTKDEKMDFAPVAVYISKGKDKKEIVLEMAILQGGCELIGVFFKEEKVDYFKEKTIYPGPELSTLPP